MSQNKTRPTKLPNDTELIGVTDTLTSFGKYTSASRAYMSATQAQQAVVPRQSDIPRTMTGFESQLADFTTMIVMPCNAMVIAIIPKYTVGIGKGTVKENGLTTIIYQSQDDGLYDFIDIDTVHTSHEVFGFRYEITTLAKHLRIGTFLRKGDVLAHSPNIKEGNVYATGIDAQVCYLGVAATIEDGIWVSEELCERSSPTATGKRSASWGGDKYPVNTHGDLEHYCPFPAPGDKIRDDNLIFAIRTSNPWLDAIEMLPEALLKPDLVHDECVYATADTKGAVVSDVTVVTSTNDNNRIRTTPVGMEATAAMFAGQTSRYYDRIIEVCDGLEREDRNRANLSVRLQRRCVDALGDRPNHQSRRMAEAKDSPKGTIQRTIKAKPIDEWQVDINYTWRYKISYGAKLSNRHGAKGVVCLITPKSEMPTDDYGNVAEVVLYGRSVIARLNPGQLFEQYFNATARDVSKDIRKLVAAGDYNTAWEIVVKHYGIISPIHCADVVESLTTDALRRNHLDLICKEGIYQVIPPDENKAGATIYNEIRGFREPDRSPVTFTNFDGNKIRTVKDVLIGSMDIIVLDKSSFKPMAVNVARMQHHGLPATTNKTTKVASPTNRQPPRVIGESEDRAISAATDGYALANITDMAVNPEAMREGVRKLFTSKNPMNIPELIDRKEIPYGSSRTVGFFKNILSCLGAAVVNCLGKKNDK